MCCRRLCLFYLEQWRAAACQAAGGARVRIRRARQAWAVREGALQGVCTNAEQQWCGERGGIFLYGASAGSGAINNPVALP